MDKKALQEQFEAIAVQNCWNINKYPAGWDGRGDDEYVDDFVSGAWWAWQHQQTKVEELQKQLSEYIFVAETLDEMYVKEVKSSEDLQKRVDAALKKLDKRRDELWSKWKGQADMQDQGAANAFEEAYWILEQALKGGDQ